MAQDIQDSRPYSFKVREKFFTFFRKSFDIFDEATDQKIYEATRVFFSFTPTLLIKDMAGVVVAKLKSNYFFQNRWKITMGENLVGEIEFPIIRFCGIKFTVHLAGEIYEASDIVGWNFTARNTQGVIGFTLDRKFFRIRDTYKVTVFQPMDPIFGLACALAIDSKYYKDK